VSGDIGVCVSSSADWKDEVVAVGVGVAERPVLVVCGRPLTLEGESEDARVVRHGRVHDVLRGVSSWY